MIVKQSRLAEKLTQKQVASYLGISTQSYQAYEAGIALPTLAHLVKLCEIFNTTPNDLLDFE